MKKIFIFCLIAIFAQNIFSQFDSSKIAGVYQWCPFHCETFKINLDFTFDYLLDGDLFNNERTSGNWKFIDKNKIYLKSPEKKLVYQVKEEKGKNSNEISVQTIDQNGAIIPGIIIKIKYLGSERQYITNEDGIVDIPKVDKVEINWLQKSANYEIKDSKANFLTVFIELNNEPFVDRTFVFRNNQLFPIYEDNTISENGYKKIRKKVSDKLFPRK